MAEIVIAVVGKVAEYMVAPIGRQLGYLFCYRSYTDGLRNKVQKLGKERNDLLISVDEATRRGNEIRPVVKDWLNRVDEITGEAEELMMKSDENKKISYFNLKSRYQLGRQAYKKAQQVVEIQEAKSFPQGVSYHVPPRIATFKEYECYESRASTMNKVMDALRDGTTTMIGVWGMGGVGKTTMVKQIAEHAKQQKLFNTVVYVDVSWTREGDKFQQGIRDIQQHVAEMLGLKFEEETLPARAGKLMERLKCEKILIILDDLWKEVTLEDVGIPSCNKDCKIVLASRHESILSHMEAQKRCPLRHLEEGEALQLFKKTAGDSVENDLERKLIAIEIVKECGGLPIAIVTIAKTLKERSVSVWKDALRELKCPAPTNNEDENQVYKCLALSYDRLKDDDLKSLFLLCGCLNYGDVQMNHLLKYAVGLDLFDRIKSIEEARDKLVKLVSDLKASSLLLDGEDCRDYFGRGASRLLFMDDDNKSVRMHDLVRDVSRNIASKDPHRFEVIEDVPFDQDWSKTHHESKFISLNCKAVHELPHRLVRPKLQFFLLQNCSPSLNIPNKFFEGMNQLKVLDLSGMDFETLPSMLQSLANLRTLLLDRCKKLGDIVVIGELKQLQVLSMVNSNVQQLPQEMAQLTNLRLLDLNDCEKLRDIAVIGELKQLEFLSLARSNIQQLPHEMAQLTNLRLLDLNDCREFRDIAVIGELKQLRVLSMAGFNSQHIYLEMFQSTNLWLLDFNDVKTLTAIDVIGELRQLQFLSMKGSNIRELPLKMAQLTNLRLLDLNDCRQLQVIPRNILSKLCRLECLLIKDSYFSWSTGEFSNGKSNACLSELNHLRDLKRIEIEIRDEMLVPVEDKFFKNLTSFAISIGTISWWRRQHKTPRFGLRGGVDRCLGGLKDTISKRLCLQGVDGSLLFKDGICELLRRTEELLLEELKLPRGLISRSLESLKFLEVEACYELKILFSLSMARGLPQLEEMTVDDCRDMHQIVEYERDAEIMEDDNVGINLQPFPKLRSLKLHHLSKLTNFGCFSLDQETTSQGMCSQGNLNILFSDRVFFSNLEILQLCELPQLEQIWHHQLPLDSFPNLRILRVENCPRLQNLIPFHLMESFKNLKEIVVVNCKGLQHVFNSNNETILQNVLDSNNEKNHRTRGCFSPFMPMTFHNFRNLPINCCRKGDKDEGTINIPIKDGVLYDGKVLFPNLEILQLAGLPRLKEIWGDQIPHDSFSNLQILKVKDCRCLINLIPCNLTWSLKNLREIKVKNCDVLQHVFELQGYDKNDEILPKLEILELEYLQGLKGIIFNNQENNSTRDGFYPFMPVNFHNHSSAFIGKEDTDKGNAKISEKGKDDNIRHFLPPSKFKHFHYLRKLHVINCGKPLDDKVSFSPNLEMLVLESFSELKEVGIPPKLKILELKKVPKLRSITCNEHENANSRRLLSPSTLKDFNNLRRLTIIGRQVEDRKKVYEDIVVSNETVPLLDGGECNYEAFKSRAPTLNSIMEALRGEDIKSIGIVGIGGVGKTTLVKQVARQAMQQELFTTQLYFDLSWTRHLDEPSYGVISYIQQKIANKLGFLLCGRNESEEAANLKQRLKKEKILIILDNIWKSIDLKKIGIPDSGKANGDDDDENECKIVLTGRDGEVLSKDMSVQKCFRVETLPLEEAWILFKKTAFGDCDCDGDSVLLDKNNNIPEELRSIAIQIVEECEGVPIAVVTIAKALKDETLLDVWMNALKGLKNCPAGKKVYSCLEWCYTHLKRYDVKSLLLLCGSLSHYGDISMYQLLQYAVGLDLFARMDSLEEVRDRLLELVGILKASGWLLEDHVDVDGHSFYGQRYSINLLFADADKVVRMHDVVYHVIREIASKDPRPFLLIREDDGLKEWLKTDESKRCNFISLHCNNGQLPEGLVCPELHFFLLHENFFMNIPNTFFQGMKKLQVLDLSGNWLATLPSSLDSLANLRTLRVHCDDITGIGKMKKLQVLTLVGSGIKRLPDEMAQLSDLRLLDLNKCGFLEVIPILSSLSRLEYLFMPGDFIWEMKGDQRNACLFELINHLSCLKTLFIIVPDAKFLTKDIQLKNLTRYAILMGNSREWFRTSRTLKLYNINRSLHLGDGMSKLLEKSEELEVVILSGTNYVLCLSRTKSFLDLKYLKVSCSPEIEYIIDSMDQRFLEHDAFPLLESLVLQYLENLEKIWHGPIPIGSFGNLKTLMMSSCPKLRYLFLLSTARGLSRLENMTIENCKEMLQIIAYERESEDEYGGGEINLELFPNLRILKLQQLPELVNFISELETSSTCLNTIARQENSICSHKVLFSKLEELELGVLPKLKDIWSRGQPPIGSLCNLRILDVYGCPHLLNLVPYHLT